MFATCYLKVGRNPPDCIYMRFLPEIKLDRICTLTIVMKCFDSLESFDARSAMKDFDGILDITIPERQSFAVRYNGP